MIKKSTILKKSIKKIVPAFLIVTSMGINYLFSQEKLQVRTTTNYELPIANCNNSNEKLNCYMMMNPAVVGETEEAIERLIVGETRPAVSAVQSYPLENEINKQVIEVQGINDFTPSINSVNNTTTIYNKVSQAANLEAEELKASPSIHQESNPKASYQSNSSIGSYMARAAKALTSYLTYSSFSNGTELSSWTPNISMQPLLTAVSSSSVLGVGALCSVLPHVQAGNEAYATYETTNGYVTPYSIAAVPDGSYIISGSVELYPSYYSLLGKINANGEKEWFSEQSYGSDQVYATAIMNNELYSGGIDGVYAYNNGGYIARNNLTNGEFLSAWQFTAPVSPYSIIINSILPTSQNTLIAFGYISSGSGSGKIYGMEFDPYSGTVLSGAAISSIATNCSTLSFNPGAVTAINDNSYIIGGVCGVGFSSTGSFLSKINLMGTNWSSDWSRIYPDSNNYILINSVAVRDNAVVFAGFIQDSTQNGFIASVDATTGTNYWMNTVGIETNYCVFNTVAFASSNTNQIMAAGACNSDAWYVLMDLNQGTLSKSAIISSDPNCGPYIQSAVANNDGTFTSVSGYCGAEVIGSTTLNKNIEIDSCFLPLGTSYSDNTGSIISETPSIDSTSGSLSIAATSLTVTNITSHFSTPSNSIIQNYQSPTCQSSSSSQGNNSSFIVEGGAVGGAVIIGALICTRYRNLIGDYFKGRSQQVEKEPIVEISIDNINTSKQNNNDKFSDIESPLHPPELGESANLVETSKMKPAEGEMPSSAEYQEAAETFKRPQPVNQYNRSAQIYRTKNWNEGTRLFNQPQIAQEQQIQVENNIILQKEDKEIAQNTPSKSSTFNPLPPLETAKTIFSEIIPDQSNQSKNEDINTSSIAPQSSLSSVPLTSIEENKNIGRANEYRKKSVPEVSMDNINISKQNDSNRFFDADLPLNLPLSSGRVNSVELGKVERVGNKIALPEKIFQRPVNQYSGAIQIDAARDKNESISLLNHAQIIQGQPTQTEVNTIIKKEEKRKVIQNTSTKFSRYNSLSLPEIPKITSSEVISNQSDQSNQSNQSHNEDISTSSITSQSFLPSASLTSIVENRDISTSNESFISLQSFREAHLNNPKAERLIIENGKIISTANNPNIPSYKEQNRKILVELKNLINEELNHDKINSISTRMRNGDCLSAKELTHILQNLR